MPTSPPTEGRGASEGRGTHAAVGVAHAEHEGRGLAGAGAHRLRPALAEEPRHGGLVGETEVAPVLGEEDKGLGTSTASPSPPLGTPFPAPPTRKCASCRAIWMKLSGLVRPFLMRPLPKAEKQKQQKSTSSASAWASP